MDFFLFADFAKRVKREVKFGGSPFYSLPCSPGFGSPYFLTFFFFFSNQNSQGYDQASILINITLFYLSRFSIAIAKTDILLKNVKHY